MPSYEVMFTVEGTIEAKDKKEVESMLEENLTIHIHGPKGITQDDLTIAGHIPIEITEIKYDKE